MDFINIYKLSKYIKDKTDALLARYGHLNKLADIIGYDVSSYDLQLSTTNVIQVNLNTSIGCIKNVNMSIATFITLNNPKINENSIIFYNLAPTNLTELGQQKSSLTMSAGATSSKKVFCISPTPPNRVTGDIHFWIINP